MFPTYNTNSLFAFVPRRWSADVRTNGMSCLLPDQHQHQNRPRPKYNHPSCERWHRLGRSMTILLKTRVVSDISPCLFRLVFFQWRLSVIRLRILCLETFSGSDCVHTIRTYVHTGVLSSSCSVGWDFSARKKHCTAAALSARTYGTVRAIGEKNLSHTKNILSTMLSRQSSLLLRPLLRQGRTHQQYASVISSAQDRTMTILSKQSAEEYKKQVRSLDILEIGDSSHSRKRIRTRFFYVELT